MYLSRQLRPSKLSVVGLYSATRPFQSRHGRHARLKPSRPGSIRCLAGRDFDQVQLLQATVRGYGSSYKARKLLVYLPGTDGTGNAISPQLTGLLESGYDVRALYICMTNRSNWDQLTEQTLELVRSLVKSHPTESQVTLVAESFGGCLALRCLSLAPDLFERAVLVNPATCFAESYGGLLSLAVGTNLLSIFPEQLYQVAQAILLPFLVDKKNVGDLGLDAVRQMILMSPPENRRVAELSAGDSPLGVKQVSPLAQFESCSPAAAGSWRLALLRTGNLPDSTLSTIQTPTLLLSSAKDRLLGSLKEGARLERVLGNAMRVVLPKSGHTALLEADVKLVEIMKWSNFLPADLAPGGVPTKPTNSSTGTSALHVTARRAEMEASGNGYIGGNGVHSSQQTLSTASTNVVQSPETRSSTAVATRPAAVAASLKQSTGRNGNGYVSTPESGSSSNGRILPMNGSLSNGAVTFTDPEQGKFADSHSQNGASRQNGTGSVHERTLQDVPSPRKSLKQQKTTLWSNPDPAFDRAISLLAPLRNVVSPVVRGAGNLPNSAVDTSRPLLLVGNHARIGLYDMPYLMIELYLRGIKVRGLAHPSHWKGPLGGLFESFGAVKASPRSAYRLLKAGEAVLLFPGGGREVNKRRGEEYKLFWSEEPDFVRMAAKLNALIVPFSSVGADEAFDLALDSSELLEAPILGNLMRSLITRVDPSLDLADSCPPLTKLPGIGIPSLVPVPNLSRLYFRFTEPIDPAKSDGILTDTAVAQKVYQQVQQQIYTGIAELQEEQRTDPKNSLPARLMEQFSRISPAFDILRR